MSQIEKSGSRINVSIGELDRNHRAQGKTGGSLFGSVISFLGIKAPPKPTEIISQIDSEYAQETQKETEAAYTALMDRMEAGVPQNGHFFIKVGYKPTNPNLSDTRVMILKEGRKREGTWGVVHGVITRGGQRKIHIKNNYEWAKLSSPFYKPSPEDGLISDKPGNRLVNLGLGGDLRTIFPIIGPEDEKFIEESIIKSIDVARQDIHSRVPLDTFIDKDPGAKILSALLNLPPKSSNGTGPAIPPLR